MSDLYNRIKMMCDAKGVSLAKMCAECGIPKSTTTDLKMGRVKSLSYAKMQKIADYFKVSVDSLVNKEKKPDTDDELLEYLEYLKNRPEMRMLFSTLKGATKEDVERAVRIIEAMRGDANG